MTTIETNSYIENLLYLMYLYYSKQNNTFKHYIINVIIFYNIIFQHIFIYLLFKLAFKLFQIN